VSLMRPCDVDRTGATWIYRPAYHKSSYREIERTIFVGPQAQAILEPWLDRPIETYCFSPAEAEAERNAFRKQTRKSKVTPSQAARRPKAEPKRPKRDRYDRDSYRRAIGYGIKKAGVPSWHPHQLRHTCGTRVRAEYGLDVAQVILGHQSADETQVYAEANQRRAIEVVRVIG
jgi:integrase